MSATGRRHVQRRVAVDWPSTSRSAAVHAGRPAPPEFWLTKSPGRGVTGPLPASGRQPRAVRSALQVLEEVVAAGPDTDLLARHPHAFALGRLLLAEHADWRVLVRELRPLTPRTVTSETELDRVLTAVVRDGIARQHGEVRAGRGCLALPVRAPDDGRLVAGLALAGPAARVAEPNTELIALAREHTTRLAPLLA